MNAERLRELLDYDPETGVFRWKTPIRGMRVRVGQIAGYIHLRGYRDIYIGKRKYQAHRLVWLYLYGRWPTDQIDHINGVKDDNRRENLREATNIENTQNARHARRNNKTKMLGVIATPWKSFKAEIKVNGKNNYLGTFATAEEAHAAYLSAKRLLHPTCTI